MKPFIILDNGHGKNTPGKRSPVWYDGSQLLEYEFNRDIVSRLSRLLAEDGICHKILVPELTDVSLPERCERANKEYYAHDKNAILISVHANAGGGTGWECFTSKGDTKADPIATIMCEEAKRLMPTKRMRFDYSDGDPDKESQFYILKYTACPAILTENFFMDNETDCRFIMSDRGRERITKVHFNAIKKIIELWHGNN